MDLGPITSDNSRDTPGTGPETGTNGPAVKGGIDLHSNWLEWDVQQLSEEMDATLDVSENIDIPIDGFIPVIVNVTTIPDILTLFNH